MPAAALDRRVRIVNEIGAAIQRFFGLNTAFEAWNEDMPGDDIQPSGASKTVDFDDGKGTCRYDLRAVCEDVDV